jgi:alanine dehydrogenase
MALILRETDVRSLVQMQDVVTWAEDATRAYGLGNARNMPRQRVKLPKGWLHVLPGGDMDQGVLGLKTYTSFRGGNRFLVLLYSAETGELLSLIEADTLGMMRTGAMSAVATKYLARVDADVLAVFGAGWQARGQVLGIAAGRKLAQIRVFSRNPETRERFAREMADLLDVDSVPSDSPEAALDGASIVSTATTSRDPVFPDAAVQPGTHINAIGSNSLIRRELDQRLVRRAARVIVDSRAQARQESGDLLIPVELGWLEWDQLPELSEILAGSAAGRRSDEEITIFESHGLGLQDISVAAHVYRSARESGVGEELSLLDI